MSESLRTLSTAVRVAALMCWALVLPNDGYAGVVNVQDNVSNLSQNFGSEVTILSSTQAKRYYDPTRLKEKAN